MAYREQLLIRISDADMEEVKKACTELALSRSSLARHSIRMWLDSRQRKIDKDTSDKI